jgi:hypothetical protein
MVLSTVSKTLNSYVDVRCVIILLPINLERFKPNQPSLCGEYSSSAMIQQLGNKVPRRDLGMP